jgi:hypothetical protein
MPTISRLKQQIARIRFGRVVYFAESMAAPLAMPAAEWDWFSVFDKMSPLKRCDSRRKDEKSGDILFPPWSF